MGYDVVNNKKNRKQHPGLNGGDYHGKKEIVRLLQ